MNKDKIKKIFKSELFKEEVPSPYKLLFQKEYPPIENGYWELDGDYVYTSYELSSDTSCAYSLIIEIYGEIMFISFDDDDGMAKYKDEELKEDGWNYKRF